MKINKIWILLFSVLFFGYASAQQNIIHYGKIYFEHKVNTHKRMVRDEDDAEWFERMKDKIPKYKITNYELDFNADESLYYKSKKQPEPDPNTPLWLKNDDAVCTMYKNIRDQRIVYQKTLLSKLFLISDSLMKYKWTMTNEFRIIAGYNCRRATTIIMDSVYVIAFYTDAILPSNGPLSLTGLPGTILGVVVPRLNLTIFANKVELASREQTVFNIPQKGSPASYREAIDILQSKSSNTWLKRYVAESIWDLRL